MVMDMEILIKQLTQYGTHMAMGIIMDMDTMVIQPMYQQTEK